MGFFSGSHNFEAAERLKQELKRAEAPPTLVQFSSLLNQIFHFFCKIDIREDVKYYFADFSRKGGWQGEGTLQIRNLLFDHKTGFFVFAKNTVFSHF